ncbi:hypothetical protein BCR34DRAFT_607192 [Clohesyomyces aquaticus]|uniref:Uncharacterized protein n=1 Tax=Clohesyomyces aquaticus TaxID=1231657 RepID=A0A1Y1YIC4_9PLEO|nr:hypothetical protein BCR34DRAFT_607192 [Clohesyomyces aquaticus]
MIRGIPKRKAPSSPSSFTAPKKLRASNPPPKKPAPQSAPHRRGGTHRVKDCDLTHTHWDTKTYDELETALRSPSRRSIWNKNLRKAQIARLLADDDVRRKQEQEQRARVLGERVKEVRRKREEERKKVEEEKKRKKRERERRRRRREDGESEVSDTTVEGEDVGRGMRPGGGADFMGIRTFIEDDSWSSSSSSTSSEDETVSSSRSPTYLLHQKLRIFEYPFLQLPSPNPPPERWSPGGTRENEEWAPETLPRKLPYAVIQLVTTVSGETVELPGRTYQSPVQASFVPKLSRAVMNLARQGCLVGPLRRARIESAREWAWRTMVQWWNGSLYFHLPPPRPLSPTAAKKTNTNTNLGGKHKPSSSKPGAYRVTKNYGKKGKPVVRKEKSDKRELMLEIYAASEMRPPICYLPAYLDYPTFHEDEDGPRTLDNLYYIRFPGMQLPHFYFWTFPDEWEDPRVMNPRTKSAKEADEVEVRRVEEEARTLIEWDHRRLFKRIEMRSLCPLAEGKMRVRKRDGERPQRLSVDRPSEAVLSKFHSAIWDVEDGVLKEGLAVTLSRYRGEWIREGKKEHWEWLTGRLVRLYPSGELPTVPPAHHPRYTASKLKSLAVKIAALHVPSPDRPVSPIQGDEPWTGDDDANWDIVDEPAPVSSSATANEYLSRGFEEFDEWLQHVSPSYEPPSLLAEKVPRAEERERWEILFEAHAPKHSPSITRNLLHTPLHESSKHWKVRIAAPDLITQISDMSVEELKWQLYSLMTLNNKLKRERHCRVCLEPLKRSSSDAVYAHYQSHRDEADARCPFCGMLWKGLASQWKASHILSHDFPGAERNDFSLEAVSASEVARRRRSSSRSVEMRRQHWRIVAGDCDERPPVESLFRRRSSVPQPIQIHTSAGASVLQEIPASKVKFSPNTVEKLVGYNDDGDQDRDFDHVVAQLNDAAGDLAPRKSVLKKGTRTPKRKDLRIETDARVNSRARKKLPRAGRRVQDEDCPLPITPSTSGSSAPSTTPVSASASPSTPLHHNSRKARRRRDSDSAPWTPGRCSTASEDHIPSPKFHLVRVWKDHDPNAAWEPRKWSQSTDDSLDFDNAARERRGRGKRRKRTINKATAEHNPHMDAQSLGTPSPALSLAAVLPSLLEGAMHQGVPSPSSSVSNPSRYSTSVDENDDGNADGQGVEVIGVGTMMERLGKKRTPVADAWSTASTAGSAPTSGRKRRFSAVEDEIEEGNEDGGEGDEFSGIGNCCVLCRRPSELPQSPFPGSVGVKTRAAAKKLKTHPQTESKAVAVAVEKDFVQFEDGNKPFEQGDEDVLQRKPASASTTATTINDDPVWEPKSKWESKAEPKAKPDRKSSTSTVKKPKKATRPTPKQVALETKKRAAALELAAKRTEAWERKLTKKPALGALLSGKRGQDQDKVKDDGVEGERRYDPRSTPSTPLQLDKVTAARDPSRLLPVPRAHSVDVPASDVRSLVPPNTPANRRSRRTSVLATTLAHESSVELDVVELKDKIKEVEETEGVVVTDEGRLRLR